MASIFHGDDGLALLAEAEESIHVDATFQILPSNFCQLLIDHVSKDDVDLQAACYIDVGNSSNI